MKGLILAAGKGTRLYPMTKPVCKPLLPVYDKPLIYYPLAILLQAGITEILIIIPPGEEKAFKDLLGDGSHLGISITYVVQAVARGIADAFLVAEAFIGSDSVCLALGDNIFYNPEISTLMKKARENKSGATVFGHWVKDPKPFGVVEFNNEGKAISIEEKPVNPKSNYIIPGLYFYDNQVIDIAKSLKPSARGELEITDVNLRYLEQDKLFVIPMDEDVIWLDAGTADSLLEASCIIRQLQSKGKYVACIEEIAWEKGLIDAGQLFALGNEVLMTEYGQYICNRK